MSEFSSNLGFSRPKHHPKAIYWKLKRKLITLLAVRRLETDVPTHRHMLCSNCKSNVSYDIWGSCPSPNDCEERVLEGPCSHCVATGQEVRLKHDWYTCKTCWHKRGEEDIMRERDTALQRQGWVQNHRCKSTWTAPREGGGKRVYAPWRDVRCGPCGLVMEGFAMRVRREEFKEMRRRGRGKLGPVLNLEALKTVHDAPVAKAHRLNG